MWPLNRCDWDAQEYLDGGGFRILMDFNQLIVLEYLGSVPMKTDIQSLMQINDMC